MRVVQHISIIALFLLVGLRMFGRQESDKKQAIQWVKNMAWDEIKQKALAENKYIFVDCFTTWCGPCKKMDREVFTDSRVGTLLREKFIAVKLQMDKTKKDDALTKKWYGMADFVAREFHVNSYPAYIILNPKGELVEKAGGYRQVEQFLAIVNGALSPGKKYEDPYPDFHAYMDRFRNGERDYSQMARMFWVAEKAAEIDAATDLGNTYYQHLKMLPEDSLYTRTNIQFIATTVHSKNMYIKMFFPNGDKVDSVMGLPGFSRYIIDSIIQYDIMGKYITNIGKNIDPDWKFLLDTVARAYTPAIAKQNVQYSQLQWHNLEAYVNRQYNRWGEYKELFFQYLNEYGHTPFFACGRRYGKAAFLNAFSWEALFLHDGADEEFRKILPFFSKGLEETRQYYGYYAVFPVDTYANLLYKYAMLYSNNGCQEVLIDQAMHWQALAMSLYYEDEYKVRLEKMRNRQPTWTK